MSAILWRYLFAFQNLGKRLRSPVRRSLAGSLGIVPGPLQRRNMPGRAKADHDEASADQALQNAEATLLGEAANKINLSSKGILIIPKLAAHLVEVDLSCNGLVRINGLANMRFLQRIVLTSNHITELHDLTGLPVLQHLLLQGNFLCTFQDVNLAMLAQLPSLQTLYLQNSDRSQPNPVCSRAEYKSAVLSALTNLRNLDDDLPSAEAHAQPNMTKSVNGQIDISKFLPPAWGPWLEDNGKTNSQAAQNGMHKAQIATARVLDECTVLSGVLRDELAKSAAKLT